MTNPLAQSFLGGLAPETTFAKYVDDPILFFEEVLGVTPWARQRDVLLAMKEHPRTAIRSGHKVGKSLLAAGAALWWVTTRRHGRVVLTSASSRQVRGILWRELRTLYTRSRRALGGDLHDDPDIGLRYSDGREVVGFSTDESERMSGISGPELLFIIDEASGIPESIFEAIEGNRAGGAKVVMFSNPTSMSGSFHAAFHEAREFWHTMHISALESPNVVAGEIAIPGLATKGWVEEKRQEWGTSSPLYQIRVQGEFPKQAHDAIISLQLVEEARARWQDAPEEGRLVIGVDVARFGDDETVLFPVRGKKALMPVVLHSLDAVDVAGHVMELATAHDTDEMPIIRVDAIGVGSGVVDQLSRMTTVEVEGIQVSEAAWDSDQYARRRDEVWFGMRTWLEQGGALPPDPKLEADLISAQYSYDLKARYQVEPKISIKKRLGRSPDRADALALAVMPGGDVMYWVSVGAPVSEPRFGRRFGFNERRPAWWPD